MYGKKIPFDIDCGVPITMEVIGGKWKCCIIQELGASGAMRPSALHKKFTGAGAQVIDQQLKELEFHRIIKKTIYPVLPPHSEYALTDTGRSLLPLIEQIERWGLDFQPVMKELMGLE